MIRRISETLLVAGAVVGALSIWLISAMVTYDVTMRFVGKPTLWALEISTYLMIGAGTFGSGLAVARGAHFAVDILPLRLKVRPRTRLALVTNCACVGLMVFVASGYWNLIVLSARLGMKSATILRVPVVYPQTAGFLGFALMALAFAVKTFIQEG